MTQTYKTGTVAVTAASATVTGTGTAWVVAAVAGGMFSCNGLSVPITSVNSDTSLTLDYPWPGTTASGLLYSIARENSDAANLVDLYTKLANLLVQLTIAGIHPNGSGTLAQRNALTLAAGDDGYLFLRAELGVAFAFYRWDGPSLTWKGPFAVANASTGPVNSVVGGLGITVDSITNPAIPSVAVDTSIIPRLNVSNAFSVTQNFNSTVAQAIGVAGQPATNSSIIQLNSINNAGAAAFMTFQRIGNFAGNFGIDTDNIWKVGGWSMGANAYKIMHEGLASGTFAGSYTWAGTQLYSAGISQFVNPATAAAFTTGGANVTIASGAEVLLPPGSGLLLLTNATTAGGVGIVLCGGGSVVVISGSNAMYINTNVPTTSQIGIYYSSGYRVKNGFAASQLIGFMWLTSRAAY